MTLTEDELARLEARHNPYRRSFEYPTPPRDACNYDNFDWPCDAFRLLAALRDTPVADTAGIDAAWREAEAALPEGWAWTSIVWSPKHREWTAGVAGPVRYTGKRPDGRNYASGDGATPAAALTALAAALRTPKPEGEPE